MTYQHQNNQSHTYSRLNWVIFGLGLFLIIAGLVLVRSDFTISATGTVERSQQVSVYAPRTGTLQEVFLSEGDLVNQGSAVLRLDDRDLSMQTLGLQRELAKVQANLERAQLSLEQHEIQPGSLELLTANEKLALLTEISAIQEEIVSQYEKLEGERAVRGVDLQRQRIEQARSRMQQLEAQVLSQWKESGILEMPRKELEMTIKHHKQSLAILQKELELYKEQLERSTVTAPISGRVVNLQYEHEGMKVDEGSLLFEVTDPESPFEVRALVGERNIDLIHQGIPVRMESGVFQSTLDGYIMGTVTEVSPVAENDATLPQGVPVYEVRIEVQSTPYELVLGSTLKTEFVLGRRNLLEVILSSMSGNGDRTRERSTQ